jgi:hypothetical protein
MATGKNEAKAAATKPDVNDLDARVVACDRAGVAFNRTEDE